MPQPLNKTLLAVANNEDYEEICRLWKSKFKSIYKHEILDATDDDDEERSQEVIVKQNERFRY